MIHKRLTFVFFFQAEDGIRYLLRSRGLGDVYKRQAAKRLCKGWVKPAELPTNAEIRDEIQRMANLFEGCLLYTSDAADERSSVDLGGRRIFKKKNTTQQPYHYQLEKHTTRDAGAMWR